MIKVKNLIVSLTIILPLVFGGVINAEAKNNLIFKFACMFPESHLRAKAWKEYCEKVKEATDGQIVFKIYPGQSLVKAKAEYEAVRAGAIDISGSPSVYISGYQPWCLYADIPGYSRSYGHAMEILKKGMPIMDREFGKAGIKLLWAHPATMFNCCSNDKVGFIKTMDDFKGVKGRMAGGFMSDTWRVWGGAPVTLPSPEMYTALQRGTVDCTYIGTDSYSSYKLWEVAPYVTKFEHPLFFHPIKMNKKAWNKIPTQLQKKILDVGRDMMNELPPKFVKDQDKLYKLMVAHGAKLYEPDPGLLKAMDDAVKPLWKKYINKAGDAGKELYKIIYP